MDLEAVGNIASIALVPISMFVAGVFFRAYRREVKRSEEIERERLAERELRRSRPMIKNGDLEEIREIFDLLMTADGNTKRRLRDLETAHKDPRVKGGLIAEILERIERLEQRLNQRGGSATA